MGILRTKTRVSTQRIGTNRLQSPPERAQYTARILKTSSQFLLRTRTHTLVSMYEVCVSSENNFVVALTLTHRYNAVRGHRTGSNVSQRSVIKKIGKRQL